MNKELKKPKVELDKNTDKRDIGFFVNDVNALYKKLKEGKEKANSHRYKGSELFVNIINRIDAGEL